ncbi:MAG: hypothetical protein ACLGSA_00275 [Acidobacteriota bacterium]
MEGSNRRTDYRVAVPEAYLRELAIWFCPARDYIRLGAAELGRPHLSLSKLGQGRIVLMDLSIRGLGLHASLPSDAVSRLLESKTCFVYLKLWDPSIEDPYGELSVFTYNQLTRVAQTSGGLFLGSHFLRFAVGSRLDKALEFLDAKACGVSHLAHWCDNILRGGFSGPVRPCGGLDMDNLLAEIETALAHPCTAGEDKT